MVIGNVDDLLNIPFSSLIHTSILDGHIFPFGTTTNNEFIEPKDREKHLNGPLYSLIDPSKEPANLYEY